MGFFSAIGSLLKGLGSKALGAAKQYVSSSIIKPIAEKGISGIGQAIGNVAKDVGNVAGTVGDIAKSVGLTNVEDIAKQVKSGATTVGEFVRGPQSEAPLLQLD
jgi:hypothetical protein